MVAPALSLRSAGLCLSRGIRVVSARSIPFPITSCACPCLPPLHLPAPPFTLPVPVYIFCFLGSSAACPVGSWPRRWHTVPDIIRTRICDWPCGTCIARSCTSTWDRICNRRQRPDNPIVLGPWCEPPASFPLSLPLSLPQFWSNGLLVCFSHLRLWLPLLLEGVSLTSQMIPAVYVYACTNSRRAVFCSIFDGFVFIPPLFCRGRVITGGIFPPTFWVAD